MTQYVANISNYNTNVFYRRNVIVSNFTLNLLRAPNFVPTHTFLNDNIAYSDDEIADLTHATHRCSITVSNTETINTLLVYDHVITATIPRNIPQLYAHTSNIHLGYPATRPVNPISSLVTTTAVTPPPPPPAPISCNDPAHAAPSCSIAAHAVFVPCTRQHIMPGNTPATRCSLQHMSPQDYAILHDFNAGTLCSVDAHQSPQTGTATCTLPHANTQHDNNVAHNAVATYQASLRNFLNPSPLMLLSPRILTFVFRMNHHTGLNARSLFPTVLTNLDSAIHDARNAPGTPVSATITMASVDLALQQVDAVPLPLSQHIGRFLRRTHTADELATYTARSAHMCILETLCPLHAILTYRSSLSTVLQTQTSAYGALNDFPMVAARSLEPVSPFFLPSLIAAVDDVAKPRLASLRQMTLDDILSSV